MSIAYKPCARVLWTWAEANVEEGARWERIPTGDHNDVLSILVQDVNRHTTSNP